MSAYRLEVRRLPVRVVGFGGEAFSADVFLHLAGEQQPGPETLGERLNAPRSRFLPFEVDGRVELVNLAAVAYVEHAGELPEVEAHHGIGGRREPVVVRLRSGEELPGALLYLFTGDGTRPSDRLNALGERFLLHVDGATVRYVNADAVASLRF
jgi:hypothetical protein